MGAPVCASDRMNLINHDNSKVTEQRFGINRLRNEHHLQRFRCSHQQLTRLPEEHFAFVARCITVPDESSESHHLGISAQSFGLIVQQGFDRGDVESANAVGLIADQVRQCRKHGRLGLATGGRCQHNGVFPGK